MNEPVITIVSSGDGPNSLVYLNSQKLEGVLAATIHLVANEPNIVDLKVIASHLSIDAAPGVIQLLCPLCNFHHNHHCERVRSD